MLSNFLRASWRLGSPKLLQVSRVEARPRAGPVRRGTSLIPPSQYDMPIPNRLHLGYVLRVYWETIPLFICTGIAMGAMVYSIVWACKNKVDIVFSSRSRSNISRTMDLRHPTNHKIITIFQRYEPWPEMQDVLDKMKAAEHKVMARAMACPQY